MNREVDENYEAYMADIGRDNLARGLTRMSNLWAAEWHSCNRLDGERRHILYEDSLPKMFRTRAETRAYIKEKYGYIATRRDLCEEPHGWRMPQAVKASRLMFLGEE